MSLNKNKSEIVKSFKNLLKKADELAVEKKKYTSLNNITDNTREHIKSEYNKNKKKIDRLGIRNIKRVPHNPYKKKSKLNNSEYDKLEKELTSKITNIFNRHINYWLKRELPDYARNKLRIHIYNILLKLKK